jgi:rhamnulokinase
VSLGGELVWDLVRLWQEVVQGLRASAARHGKAVTTVGVDTWGVDYAFLGADGALLANPLCYRDPRNRGMIEVAEKTVPHDEIFAATGLQFMDLNTLYQLLAMQRRRADADGSRHLPLAAVGRGLQRTHQRLHVAVLRPAAA